MSEENDPADKRLYQMSNEHLEYRIKVLEDERLPHRVQAAEIVIGQLQGEVTAIKEIARSIGVKLDSGVEKIATESNSRMDRIELGRAEDKSFIKGVLWIGGIIGALFAIGPVLGDIAKRLLGV